MIEASGLTKSFPFPSDVSVLKDIGLVVPAGKTVAIVGASGEGKSTLLHILGTLEAATAGTLKLGGETVSARNASSLRNQLIGFIFQAFQLLQGTALDNVLMPARIARKSVRRGSKTRRRALELLEQVGLADRAHFPTKLLSGGERQRVAMARALMNDPGLILADEPSGNLDSANSAMIHRLLLRLVKEQGKTLVTVTHDSSLAALCDSRYVLSGGVLHSSLDPLDLSPKSSSA